MSVEVHGATRADLRRRRRPDHGDHTVVLAASPRTRLARLDRGERRLLLLLAALGREPACALLDNLVPERRELLAPLLAEVFSMDATERRSLFACAFERQGTLRVSPLNQRLARERSRLAHLLIRELAPRRTPSAPPSEKVDPGFALTLTRMADRWLDLARPRP